MLTFFIILNDNGVVLCFFPFAGMQLAHKFSHEATTGLHWTSDYKLYNVLRWSDGIQVFYLNFAICKQNPIIMSYFAVVTCGRWQWAGRGWAGGGKEMHFFPTRGKAPHILQTNCKLSLACVS